MNCCEHHAPNLPHGNCRQGRDCPARTANGGERVSLGGGTYYPLLHADEPVPRAEDVIGWTPYLGVAITLIGAILGYIAAVYGPVIWPWLVAVMGAV